MLSIGDAIGKMTSLLNGEIENPRFEAEIILSHVLKKDRVFLNAYKDSPICDDDFLRYEDLCQKRKNHMPFAYITNQKEFMGLDFYVDENVLIPRCETEMLVEYAISKYKDEKIFAIDLCSGTGAIGISLAYYLKDTQILGIDISQEALKVSQKNSLRFNLNDRVSFMCADVLKPIDVSKKADVVFSNPPYIKSDVINTLTKDVKNYEPLLALDGSIDGLIFYREIVNNIECVLKHGGELILEIGYDQKDDVCEILKGKFKNIKTYKDIFSNDRMVCAQLI